MGPLMSSFINLSKSKFSEVIGAMPGARREGMPADLPLRPLSDIAACRSGVKLARKADTLICAYRQRSDFFPPNLIADPAWDILLTLAKAELQFRQVSTADLCDAAVVPTTTALRWINHLAEAGWIERYSSELNPGRSFVVLSVEASSRIRAYLEGLSGALGLPDFDSAGASQEMP